MRNVIHGSMSQTKDEGGRMKDEGVWRCVILLGAALLGAGCAGDNRMDGLKSGYAALESQQYDQAISEADAFLAQTPAGAGSAEALYLRGRAFEQRTAASPHEAAANLQNARAAYVEALRSNPSPKLGAYIHTSVANVAYFQDDYATALNEWAYAYEKLDDEEVRAWVLYRIALCHQRMGRFGDADRVFAVVERTFPGTLPAQRAKE